MSDESFQDSDVADEFDYKPLEYEGKHRRATMSPQGRLQARVEAS